ncbi:MAG TPA: hypothetical protein VJ986_03790 [Gaiellaceae bacterium]|nr:hypothetical protein [Gaiellaceae bacterium]
MGLLDKAKSAAETAAQKAKEGVEDVQTRKDLHGAYVELGKKTVELVDAGTLEHAELTALVGRVTELRAKLEDDAAESQAEPASSGPPAKPL